MNPRVKTVCKAIAAPLLCLALLGAMSVEQRRHVPPPDVAGYHLAVKHAIENDVPWIMGPGGKWVGTPMDIPEAAQKLLRLNAFVSRHYTDNGSGASRRPRSADLLIVQCSDSSDMDGHWPPKCYPARGETLEFQQPLTFDVGGMSIPLNEYHFVQNVQGRTERQCVYNFLIVPHVGVRREMDDLRAAAADYRERFFGAAQVQVVMDGDLPQEEREQIFKDLIYARHRCDPGD